MERHLKRSALVNQQGGEWTMKYGRRIRNGENGEITWCELNPEEVTKTLRENVSLNADLYQKCFEEALVRAAITKPEDRAALSLNPQLRREVLELAIALFEQSAVKAFVCLQQALDAKVHWHKVHAMA